MLLRQDNADIRLTEKSYDIGLAREDRLKRVREKKSKSNEFKLFYSKTSFELEEINPILKSRGYKEAKQKDKLAKVYSRPKITGEQIKSLKLVSEYIKKNNIDEETFEQTEIQIKYQGYIEKEKNNADKLSRLENIKIPKNFNYNGLSSLSFEAKEKLNKIKPMTLSQASRISGIKPSDISVLLVKMGR
jgi:tRNA uridine 5-carboxymethylaminomethyl modification enzyme